MISAVNHRNYFIIGLILCWAIELFHPFSSSAITARDKYHSAEACYKKLLKAPQKQKYRHNWLQCIEKFQKVYKHDPKGPWAAAGLYRAGKLYRELYKRSFKPADKKEALDLFERIIKRFPKSLYKKKASLEIRAFYHSHTSRKPFKTVRKNDKEKTSDPIHRIIKAETASLNQRQPDRSVKTLIGGQTTVVGLRFWSNPSYTRIVIDLDGETSFTHRLLKKDPAIDKPQRLFVDLKNSLLGKGIKRIIPIDDDLLIDARAGQYTPESVRVVADIKSFERYKIFSLTSPFRIVIDVWGETKAETTSVQSRTQRDKDAPLPSSALAKQLSLGVKRIVIDPGHGGKDFGAPGYVKGVYEKHITLQLAKMLAPKIRKKLGCEVFLTRNTDRYLTLEERTAIANTKNADLFISIHANASRNRNAHGIETYFLNLATDDESILVAARENATSTKNISDLQTILNDLMQNAKINESSRLAVHVQQSLCSYLKSRKYGWLKDKGVKQAPFYVLLGAQMPAILIEVSFISNPRECKRLADPRYQNHVSEAIVRAIQTYIREIQPTALRQTPPPPRKGG